jgi:steroid delta-isomerase-like uncharacterized protein
MSPQEMRELIESWGEEIFHKGNLDKLEDFLTPDYVRHTNPGGREGGRDIVGVEDTRRSIAAFRGAFPDVHFATDDMLVDGDKVVVRWTCTGTHRGPFRGIPPTGKHVRFIGINIYRLRAGKIVERWAVEDYVSLMQQLRVAPA